MASKCSSAGDDSVLIAKIEENCEHLSLEDSSTKGYDLNLPSAAKVDHSILEDADCSCTSSNQSSTDGESDFPSADRDLDRSVDSGVDSFTITEDSFICPDKELMDKIINQVEFYFSDENLKKDNFLLKHVCRTKEGNVSLKLVSSFRKVKAIAKDWRVVAYSLRHSDKLIVNKEGSKIKRKDPLPEGCKPIAALNKVNKSVVAFNLPFDKPCMENVAELFSRCGEISLIHILRPGAIVPTDIKRAMMTSNHPEIGSCVCAVIEFESQEFAARALNEMDSKDSDWRALHVVPLMSPARNPATNFKDVSTSKNQEIDELAKQKKMIKKGKKQDRVEKLRLNDPGDSPPCSPDWSPKPRKRSNTCYCSSSINERRNGPPKNTISPAPPRNKERMRPKSNSWGSWAKPGASPWVQRRMQAAKDSTKGPPANVATTRQPKGPDGTQGFHPSYQMLRSLTPSPNGSA